MNRRGFEALLALQSSGGTDAAEAVLSRVEACDPRQRMRDHAQALLAADIASLTAGKSHADLLQALTGENLLERVNDYMIGLCSAFLDEGLAAWHLPGRALGFYESWRNLVAHDRTFDFDGLTGWRGAVDHLPVVLVGAGINLEYYFSTVDIKVYGSDTKVPHNVTGLIGVMEGAHSDLRTGLPKQMTEVHEAMRLNLIVDAPMAVLGEIYGRQPGIQELPNGEWVILIAHDPETGELNQFVPGVGFGKWDDSVLEPIPDVPDSYAWFKGKYEKFLPPARIAEPTRPWTH